MLVIMARKMCGGCHEAAKVLSSQGFGGLLLDGDPAEDLDRGLWNLRETAQVAAEMKEPRLDWSVFPWGFDFVLLGREICGVAFTTKWTGHPSLEGGEAMPRREALFAR